MKTSAKILALLGVSGQGQAVSTEGLLNSTDNQQALENMMVQQEAQDGPPVPGIPGSVSMGSVSTSTMQGQMPLGMQMAMTMPMGVSTVSTVSSSQGGMAMSGGPMGMAMSAPMGMSVVTTGPEVVTGAVLSANAMEGDEPEVTIEQAVEFEMQSEEMSGAVFEDVQEDELDPQDSQDATDPEDEVPDFIDEIEVVEIVTDPVTQTPAPAPKPTPPPPVYANADYDPNCPGLNPKHCHKTGADNTHKRDYVKKKRNNFLFKKHINDNQANCYLNRYPDLQAAFKNGNPIAQAKQHWEQFGHKEKRNKHCMPDMDDDMAQCYLNRYDDIEPIEDQTTVEAAKEHFLRWGFFEGRNPHCAKRLTNYQAKCYLEKYVDLQQAFGFNIKAAKRHWKEFGSKEGRDPSCKSAGPEYCGLNGDLCACHGTVHVARWQSSALQSSAQAMTWEQASGFLTDSRHVNKQYRGEPFGNKWRMQVDTFDQQYFCEEKPPKEAYMCGHDGQNCACNGVAIYARMTSDDGQPTSFEQAFEAGDFEFHNSHGAIGCDAHHFNAHDFLPGIQKQCFCDAVKVHEHNHYNRKRAERINREVIRLAQVEEERLQAETLEIQRKAQEKLAKIEADAKAALAANAAAAQAAKAAEDAAFAKAEAERAAAEKVASAAKTKADTEAHKEEAEALAAAQAVAQAEVANAALAQEASQASALDKMDLELKLAKQKADAETQKIIAEETQRRFEAQAAADAALQAAQQAKIEGAKVAADIKAAEIAQLAKAKAAAEEAKQEIIRLAAEEEAERAATENARKEAQIKQAVMEALAEQARLQALKDEEDAKQAAIQAEIQRREDEERARIAAEEAERLRIEEAAALAEEQRLQAISDAEEARLRANELARREQAKLEQQAIDALRANQIQQEKEAKEAAQAAAHATSAAEIAAAQEKIRVARAKIEEDRLKHEALKQAKYELVQQRIAEEKAAALAKAEAHAAQQRMEQAKAAAEAMKKLKEETNAKMIADKAAAAKATADARAAAEAEKQRTSAAAAAAKVAADAAALVLRQAAEAEHKAHMDAKRKRDQEQAESHKREMLARKEAFEARFKHVWGSSASGLSIVSATFEEEHIADDATKSVFANTLAAEAHEIIDVQKWTHTCLTCARATSNYMKHAQTRVTWVTNDDRVAELIETVIERTKVEDLNIVVNQMIAASGDYIDWAKQQTIPLPGGNDYFNVDPFANSTAIATEAVSKMANHETGQNFEVEALLLSELPTKFGV